MRSDSSARAVSMMIGIAAVVALPRDGAADFEAVDLRQHQVEDEQIRRPIGDRLQRVAARRQHLGRESRLLQVARDELGDVAVVFDDENARHDAAAPAAIPLMVTTRRVGERGSGRTRIETCFGQPSG